MARYSSNKGHKDQAPPEAPSPFANPALVGSFDAEDRKQFAKAVETAQDALAAEEAGNWDRACDLWERAVELALMRKQREWYEARLKRCVRYADKADAAALAGG